MLQNRLYLVHTFRLKGGRISVGFARIGRGERRYYPTASSLKRLSPLLRNVNVHLTPEYFSIYHYPTTWKELYQND